MPKTDAEKRCASCGQIIPHPKLLGPQELLNVLTHGEPKRDVYMGQDGSWWVTHGGGQTSYSAVKTLLDQGAITEKYNTLPEECYWVGRTIDMTRLMEDRKKLGKKATTHYIGDPPNN